MDCRPEGLYIRPEVSKTQTPRIVPWNDSIKSLIRLDHIRTDEDRLCPATYPITHRETRRLREEHGIEWGNDILRHSYGTYRMAILRDHGKVATEMGNSGDIVKRHYDAVTWKEVATQWFSIT